MSTLTTPTLDPAASASPGLPPLSLRAADPALTSRQQDFSSILARANTGGDARSRQDRATSAAQDFVAMALVQPLLAHLRQTNHAAPPFQPTQGERQFRSMLDAQLARQIVRRSRLPLVDHVARNLLKHAQDAAAMGAAAPSETSR